MPTRPIRKRNSQKSRTELLAEIADLPHDAFIPDAHAAAFLGTTPSVLMSWRSQRRGPRFYGSRAFVRYRLEDLDRWMATRADEVPEFEKFEVSKAQGVA
jgi:hypothetical protein